MNGHGATAPTNPASNRRTPPEWPGLTAVAYAQMKKLDHGRLYQWGVHTVTYLGKPAMRISYRDAAGKETAVRFRVSMEKGDGWDRFLWQKGAKIGLYGRDRLQLAMERGYVVLPEGESDAHTLWHYDEPALGIPGASNWNEERDAPLLSEIPIIYVPIEPDQGGDALRAKLIDSSLAGRIQVIDLSPFGVKDVSALHCADPERFTERWQAAMGAARPLLEVPPNDVTEVTDSMGDEGAVLFTMVFTFLGRYVAYPSAETQVAHTLWIIHTHLMDCWDSTPRLAFLSPEPASGKTRGLEVSELLVPRPVEAINVTAAYLFRKVDDPDGAPTVLFDEIDTIFGPKAREHEDVRGLLNAGHRKGAVAGRCVVKGKMVETVEYPAYCAVALAGLGDLPDTVLTRSVVIPMRRRSRSERVEPFRRRVAITEGYQLRDRIAAWAREVAPQLLNVWPEMPAGVEDRDADVWEALLAVADAAGGEWPARARKAAVALVAKSKESTPSLGIRLLNDVKTIFGDRDKMTADEILSALNELPEAPWSEIVAGKPLNTRGLAKRLTQYGIKSKTVRTGVGNAVARGYDRADFADAWERYPMPSEEKTEETGQQAPDASPSASPKESVTSVTSVTTDPIQAEFAPHVTDVTDVTVSRGSQESGLEVPWENGQAAPYVHRSTQTTRITVA